MRGNLPDRKGRMEMESGEPYHREEQRLARRRAFDYVYLRSLGKWCRLAFLLGGVPGLASCQPSREPNDSFDPIRICAKSTLCSLRAAHASLQCARPPCLSVVDPLCQAAMACERLTHLSTPGGGNTPTLSLSQRRLITR
ncbi:unnamed protein product [Pleuronectes platessa]|uniref:Uncharacterized protein n=1 Tax=Pleuronectes platessa TaxID=8262 RepID=A0A9N7YGM3_PLEPL|nr:unnamed protein product [Pleuronectes platessa]